MTDTIGHLCDMSGLPVGNERDWPQTAITSLAEVFSGLLNARYLRMLLDFVATNACRKFPVDAITARLVCTYRDAAPLYGVSIGGNEPKCVVTIQTGAPILLRGKSWPEQPPSGLLHRSPAIEGTGEARLVLELDTGLDPDNEA